MKEEESPPTLRCACTRGGVVPAELRDAVASTRRPPLMGEGESCTRGESFKRDEKVVPTGGGGGLKAATRGGPSIKRAGQGEHNRCRKRAAARRGANHAEARGAGC